MNHFLALENYGFVKKNFSMKILLYWGGGKSVYSPRTEPIPTIFVLLQIHQIISTDVYVVPRVSPRMQKVSRIVTYVNG